MIAQEVGEPAQSLEAVLGECYKRAVLNSDRVGAVAYLTTLLRSDANLRNEAGVMSQKHAVLLARSGGSIANRCHITAVHADILTQALNATVENGKQ